MSSTLPVRPANPATRLPTTSRRQGVVTSVTTLTVGGDTVPAVTVDMGGAVGPVRVLEPYQPMVGDTVEMLDVDGDRYVLGRLADGTVNGPTKRINQLISTADSAAIGTTETVVRTLSGSNLVDGRTYRVRFRGQIGASANGNDGAVKIREDSISGTVLQDRTFEAPGVLGQVDVEAEYTADATGAKTFVITLDLVGGAGSVNLDAGATFPDHFTIDYIRG